MACGHPLASFSCKNCPPSAPFACRGGDWPSFTSTALRGGRPGPFGAVKLPPTPQTPEISTTTPPTRPMAGKLRTPNFFFFHWREKSTPDGKICLFFCFSGFFVFLVKTARFGIRQVFFMEFLHPVVHTFFGVVLDPKKL